MKKYLSVFLAVWLCFFCSAAKAEDSVQIPVVICTSGAVYAVDYTFRVNGDADIQDVRCAFSGGMLEWSYDASEARLYISLASAYAFPKTEHAAFVTADAGISLSLESVMVNGIPQTDVYSAHTESEIPAVPPTCDNGGWTAGKKCSVCGYIMEQPQPVPALGPDVKISYSSGGSITVSGKISDNAAAAGRIVLEVLSEDRQILQERDITDQDQTNFSVTLENCTGAAFVRISRLDAVTGNLLKELLCVPVDIGFSLTGKIKSFGDPQDIIHVALLQNNELIQETETSGADASYTFTQLPAGEYVLRISKDKHVTREYSVTAGNP